MYARTRTPSPIPPTPPHTHKHMHRNIETTHMSRHLPGELEKIRQWFRDYKASDGEQPVEFAFGGRCLDGDDLDKVRYMCHGCA